MSLFEYYHLRVWACHNTRMCVADKICMTDEDSEEDISNKKFNPNGQFWFAFWTATSVLCEVVA